MDEGELEILAKNEIEWRKAMFKDLREMRAEQVSQGKAIECLKVKSGIWGAVSGMFTSIGLLLMVYARGILKQ